MFVYQTFLLKRYNILISIFILLRAKCVSRLFCIFQLFYFDLLFVCYDCIVEKKKTKSFYAAKIVSIVHIIFATEFSTIIGLFWQFRSFHNINIGESIQESEEPYVVLGIKIDPQDARQE